MRKLFMLALLGLAGSTYAQNLDNEKVTVNFLRYPTDPLPEDIKTYYTDMYISSLPTGESRDGIERAINSAMSLPGYEKIENESEADLKIKVSHSNLFVGEKKLVTEDKEKKDKDGKVTKWKEYHYDYSYKYPMKLEITNKKTGESLYDDYVNNSQDYKAASTSNVNSYESAKKTYDSDIVGLRSKGRSTNLNTVSNIIKRRYGYTPTVDYVTLKKVKKFKKYDYPVLNEGVDILAAALGSLEAVENYNTPEFQAEVQKAIAKFEIDLEQADFSDKKARVNEKIASAIYNNLALAYYWMNDFDKATEMADKADGLKGDSWAYTFKKDLSAKKERYEANGLIETESD